MLGVVLLAVRCQQGALPEDGLEAVDLDDELDLAAQPVGGAFGLLNRVAEKGGVSSGTEGSSMVW
ncbi:hypothetical protein QQY24_01145 [Streptomyces sp. TG1A-8]|uniref:hypothetical protein n=1 Tax=Streptomyces sp. TG1A-8 TaxID=3051385 RepID=UPI00265BC932|nr:hypothetical protein [Streptomyces sp. TG1A-8]MDO0924102.1 hypothetical protein [Streptomyces sp. TG1A-8]